MKVEPSLRLKPQPAGMVGLPYICNVAPLLTVMVLLGIGAPKGRKLLPGVAKTVEETSSESVPPLTTRAPSETAVPEVMAW